MNKAAKDTNRKVGGNLQTLRLRAKDNELRFSWVKLQFTERHPSLHIKKAGIKPGESRRGIFMREMDVKLCVIHVEVEFDMRMKADDFTKCSVDSRNFKKWGRG